MAEPGKYETIVRAKRYPNPEPNPPEHGKDDRGRNPRKFGTIVGAKRDPIAEERGTADRGTGAKKNETVVRATREPRPQGLATTGRGTREQSFDPAVSHRPAPDAFRGVELYYVVGDEYFRGTSSPNKVYRSGYYWIIPQLRKESGEIVAYTAFNPNLRRNEFAIGPNELSFFFKHEALYRWLASSTYPIVGEPRPYEVQHGRMIASMFRGNTDGMVEHFGSSWGQALNDPVWYTRALGSVVGIRTAPATSESATMIPKPGSTTATQAPPKGTTTYTAPPSVGATSSSAASTQASKAARATEAKMLAATPSSNAPVASAPVIPLVPAQSEGGAHPSANALNEPSPYARGGPLTIEERLRAERLLSRSLGQAPTEPIPVNRWGGHSKVVSTRVIEAGPDGKPLVVEFSGRGVNGELVTVRNTAGQGGGRVVRMEIRNINNLERVKRDAELSRAMKAAGMGDWEKNLGHIQPSAAKGAEWPYNFEPQGAKWNKAVAGRVNRRTAEALFQDYLNAHPSDVLNTEISRRLSKTDALLSERFRITKLDKKAVIDVLDVEVTTVGELINRIKDSK